MKTGTTSLLALLLCAIALPVGAKVKLDYATLWLSGDQLPAGAAAAQTEDVGTAPARDLRVSVWHGRQEDAVYDRGDALEVYFRTNRDLYVVVYRIDADGYVEVLWPTSRYDDGFAYGGHDYVLPPDGSTRRLRVSTNKGVEYLEAIASEYPFDLRDLGIDFRFGREEGERYDYAVDGDPFLAINDVNYAITGLEEDVAYVVTDFSHYFVESEVDHARYACRQCHEDDYAHHPYEQTCSNLSIRFDFGWYDSWYVRYGWYPIYYDPYYTYWDSYYGWPYYYWYYPLYYSWPSYYYTYCRPYPVYYYNGPVRQHTNGRQLYQPGGNGISDLVRRDLFPTPTGGDGVQRGEIAANRPTQVTEQALPRLSEARSQQTGAGGRTGPSVRERQSASPLAEHRLSSLPRPSTPRVESSESRALRSRASTARENARSWTRPVVRNREARTFDDEQPRLRSRSEPTQREQPAPNTRSLRARPAEKPAEQRSVDRPREIRRPDPPSRDDQAQPRSVQPRGDAPKSQSRPAPSSSQGSGRSGAPSRGSSGGRSGDRGRG